MSLNFDYKNVADWKAASTHPLNENEWHPIGNMLVWTSLVCGYNHITEANAEKVAQRLMEYQMVSGPLLEYGVKENGVQLTRKCYIDLPEVKRYIGLRTNASSMTDAEWKKHLFSIAQGKVSDHRWRNKETPTALAQFAADVVTIQVNKKRKAEFSPSAAAKFKCPNKEGEVT